jgi:hypothetical protein
LVAIQHWKVADVTKALVVTSRTIEHLKKPFIEEGLKNLISNGCGTYNRKTKK